jgi:hypothetical protein
MLTDEQLARAKEAWETTDKTAADIGALFGVSKNSIVGLADRRDWTRPGKVLSERSQSIIALRKTTDLSMRQIARQLGLSKNVVQGVLQREASELVTPRDGEPRTLHDRCDALHAKMDAVLAVTKGVPGLTIKGKSNLLPNTWTRGMLHGD